MEQGGKENDEHQHDGDDEEDERDADGQMRKDAEESAQDDGGGGLRGRRVDEVTLPLTPGSRDDVVFAGLNGVSFYFLRGKECQMPAAVAEILKSCGEM